MMQGYPLAMISYGIGILQIIKKLNSSFLNSLSPDTMKTPEH